MKKLKVFIIVKSLILASLDYLKYNWNSYWSERNFNRKIKQADKLHKLTGKRYYVIPLTDTELTVVNGDFITEYNKLIKGKGKKLTFQDLIKWAYYSTPCRSISQKTKVIPLK